MASLSEDRPLKKKKSRNIKLFKNGNPTPRPFLSRVFGMATTLVITLGLVGVVIYLRKTLPDGSKPSYASSSTLQARGGGAEGPTIIERQRNLFTLAPVFTAGPPILPGDFPIISSTVDCTTVMVPARQVKRQGYWHTYCSTSYFTITRTPTVTLTTKGPLFTLRPTRIFTFRLPSGSPVVDCTTYVIPDKLKRGEEVDCTTRYVPFTTSTRPTTTVTTTPTETPTETSTITPPTTRPPTSMTISTSSTVFSSTISTSTTTTTTTVEEISTMPTVVDPCATTWIDCQDRIEGKCLTFTLTLSDCPSTSTESVTTTTPIVTSTVTAPPIVDTCMATSVTCTTIPIILARGLRRADRIDCMTFFSTLEECISTSTTTATPSTSLQTSTASGNSKTITISPSFTSINLSTSTPGTEETTPASSSEQSTSAEVSTTDLPETLPPSEIESPTTVIIPSLTTSTATFASIPTAISISTSRNSLITTLTTAPTTTSTITPTTSPTASSAAITAVLPSTSATNTLTTIPSAMSVTTIPITIPTTTPETPSTVSPTISTNTPLTPSSVVSSNAESNPGSTTSTNVRIPGVSTSLQTETTNTESTSLISSTSGGTSTRNVQTTDPTNTATFWGTEAATETNSDPFVIAQVSSQPEPDSTALTVTGSSSSSVTSILTTNTETEEAAKSASSQESTIVTGSISSVVSSSATNPSRILSSTLSSPDTTHFSSFSSAQKSSGASTEEPTPIAQTGQTATGSATVGPGETTATSSPSPDTGAPALMSWPYWKITESLTGNHAPLIVGRGFMLMMGAFYQQVITHDPVRQLTSGGISATELVSPPIGASEFGLFVAQIGTIFVAGGTYVDTNYCNDLASPTNINPCPPKITGNPWVLDIIITILVIQAGVVAYTMSKWFQKPGRLSADPTTIAGVAAVMGHPQIEQQFSSFGGEITQQELLHALKGQKFKLGTFTTEDGVTKYGIMPVALYERKDRNQRGWWARTRDTVRSGFNKAMFFRNWKLNRLFLDVVFGLLLVALLGLTLASLANIDQPQKIFLPTAVASGVGMKILFALLGVLISSNWGRLFQDTQTFSPYFPLRDGEARPNPTILLNRHSSPICAFIPLLRNRHLAAASVAFTGIIAEFLIIALAGLPYRPGQLRSEFLFCGIASTIILCVMLVQLALVIIWRRKLPHLPRQPDTIAAVMTYVAGTSMVRDFYGLEEMKTRERNKAIVQMGKVYAYGWRQEPEGGIRWIVDEVPDAERKSFLSGTRRSAESSAGGRGWYRPRGREWRRDV
ncbi:uncharacterized protein QC761_118270 [Podospora bellae-mahoneyi]|uniref:Zonadhesin n=1 Tax=Podospora bellae-mahoneyi TaxID=2093777 RepID=A0ABR0G0W8_9PEZI|nr:hypothetical protein QC761_118270 [Podospora bellae-mahoneyi]